MKMPLSCRRFSTLLLISDYIIRISAIIIGIGLAGNLVCVVARAIMESKKQ